MQFSLHLTDLNNYFFQKYLHFERSSNFCSIYPICYTLLPWKPNKPDIFMKLKEWSHDVTIGKLINVTAQRRRQTRDVTNQDVTKRSESAKHLSQHTVVKLMSAYLNLDTDS